MAKVEKRMSMLERWKYDEEHYMDNLFAMEKMDGPWVSFYDNGQKKEEGMYENGREVGVWTFYNEDGSIKFTKEY